MKKVLTTLITCLALPALAFAAFDSVQLSAGTTLVFSVGGSNLEFTVTNGNVQDVQADNANATFTLAAGSTLTISSSDRKKLDHSALNRVQASFSCTSSSSSIALSLPAGASDEVVTVTPSTATCKDPTATSAYVTGNEPVSAPGPAPAPAPTPAPVVAPAPSPVIVTVPATVVAQPSPVAQLVSPVFNKDLQLGSRGDDVKRLQELLKSDKEIYPDGLVTGYYGALTKSAILKFQLKYGVVKSASDQGAGRLGPKTRAKIKEVFESAAPKPSTEASPAPAPAAGANQALQNQIQLLLKQVQELQAKLKKQ